MSKIKVVLDGESVSLSSSPLTGDELYKELSIASGKTLHRKSPGGTEIERSEKSYNISDDAVFVTTPE